MSYSLDVTQQNIIDHVEANMVPELFEIAIPEPETIKRNRQGKIVPYIAFQFGDLQDGYSETFGGAETNDFWLPIYFQVVASEAVVARKISNQLVKVLLGFHETYGGQVRKRMGGGMFPIGNMDGATTAYIFPTSFGVKIQLFEDV